VSSGGLELEVHSLREAALRNGFHSETSAVTGMVFRHAEFSEAEIEAVRLLVGRSIAAVERELICETLLQRGGNRTHAATVLGISIRGLRNKIRAYRTRGRGITEPRLHL
jgi:DNA-binding NtrC family response regulator